MSEEIEYMCIHPMKFLDFNRFIHARSIVFFANWIAGDRLTDYVA